MQKYISEARLLLALAIPVILAQIAQTAMGFVDTVMAGGYSATDMAAVAIGTSIWLPAILFGHGLLLALTPVIAQLNGSGRRERIAHQVRQGFWLAGFVSVLIMLVLWNAGYIIRSMENIDPALADKAVGYLRALLWGAPGYLFFQVARNQCEGLAKTKPGMVMGFIGLLVNIPVNYIFIYGHFGMPELGGVGCGVATAAVYWVMFLAMVSYIKRARSMRDIRNKKGTAKPDPAVMKRLIQLGLPIALALFFEVTLFAVVALLVSPLGIVDVAGHQIALNFSSLMFVLPMSLAAAVTIRVGYRLGQGSTLDAQTAARTGLMVGVWSLAAAVTIRVGYRLGQGSTLDAQTAARTGLMVGVCMATLTAIFTVSLREQIALLYNDNPEVVTLAAHLMLLAAVYQISDSIQVIGSGILRGYKDTRSIFYITFTAYWVLGLPSGYILALTDLVVEPMGPAGFWIGFIIGLTSAAIMMMLRMRFLQRMPSAIILQRASR
ncbi:MdtK family multidrug efflux MATE transporter [Shigella sonnei]|nr:MdtK family multidrug efflux MATE transporter [Shigella sonnei]